MFGWILETERKEGRKEGRRTTGLALSVEEFFCSSSSFWRSPDFLLPAFEVSAACYHQKVLLFFPLSSTLQFVDDVFFLGLMGLGS